MIIWDRTDGEHDVRVRTFLKCCVDKGITLSKEKCRFGLNEIPFMGHVLTSDGLKPDPSKVEAVQKMAPPQDKAAVVERLRGTVNYLSDLIHPIYNLAHPASEWTWDAVHEKAFAEMKRLLTQAPVLTYFDPCKGVTIQCDASGHGLRRKCLPLYSPSRSKTNILMRALAYDIEVRYLNGKEMYLADTLSSAHLPRPSDCGREELETIKALSFLVMPEEKIYEIRRYTSEDTSLQQLKRTIQEGWPADQSSLPPLVTTYFSVRDELAVTDGLMFRGEGLVPKGMRAVAKKDIHSRHQGSEACLCHAREHVF